jgi:hypothetical protein
MKFLMLLAKLYILEPGVQSNYVSAIDNTFVDNSKLENYTVEPLVNGLSDHKAQLIEINDINLQCGSQQY